MKTLKVLSALISYPTVELTAAASELRGVLAVEGRATDSGRQGG